jgi:hypothetical protein
MIRRKNMGPESGTECLNRSESQSSPPSLTQTDRTPMSQPVTQGGQSYSHTDQIMQGLL